MLFNQLLKNCVQMDALISHSSKSYYACVGESTHAFQSPSKDLTAINNRLNGLNGYASIHVNLIFGMPLVFKKKTGFSSLIKWHR